MNSCQSVYLRMETQSELTCESSGTNEQLSLCSPRDRRFLNDEWSQARWFEHWWMLAIVIHLRLVGFFQPLRPLIEIFTSMTISGEKFLVLFINPLAAHRLHCDLVAALFTDCRCSLRRGVSPRLKWLTLILSAHFFLIMWFVSFGNRSWPQPRLFMKIQDSNVLLFVEGRKNSYE